MFGFSNPFVATKPSARRPRNPRFALECLEQRLHPSGFGLTTVADVGPVEPIEPVPLPVPQPDGDPPIDFPPIPGGPVLPA